MVWELACGQEDLFNLCYLLMHYIVAVKAHKCLPYGMLLNILFKYLGVDLEYEYCTAVNKKCSIDEAFVGKTKVVREAKLLGGKGKVLSKKSLLNPMKVRRETKLRTSGQGNDKSVEEKQDDHEEDSQNGGNEGGDGDRNFSLEKEKSTTFDPEEDNEAKSEKEHQGSQGNEANTEAIQGVEVKEPQTNFTQEDELRTKAKFDSQANSVPLTYTSGK